MIGTPSSFLSPKNSMPWKSVPIFGPPRSGLFQATLHDGGKWNKHANPVEIDHCRIGRGGPRGFSEVGSCARTCKNSQLLSHISAKLTANLWHIFGISRKNLEECQLYKLGDISWSVVALGWSFFGDNKLLNFPMTDPVGTKGIFTYYMTWLLNFFLGWTLSLDPGLRWASKNQV